MKINSKQFYEYVERLGLDIDLYDLTACLLDPRKLLEDSDAKEEFVLLYDEFLDYWDELYYSFDDEDEADIFEMMEQEQFVNGEPLRYEVIDAIWEYMKLLEEAYIDGREGN